MPLESVSVPLNQEGLTMATVTRRADQTANGQIQAVFDVSAKATEGTGVVITHNLMWNPEFVRFEATNADAASLTPYIENVDWSENVTLKWDTGGTLPAGNVSWVVQLERSIKR